MRLLTLALALACASAQADVPAIKMPKALSQPAPSLPAAYKQAHPGETVSATYKICVDTTGAVEKMLPIQGIPEADQSIVDHIKDNWSFEKPAVKICSTRTFLFKIPPATRPPQ
jgi:hypothetical protein